VSSSPFNMETNSQRTVLMFSTRTLLVSSASLCSRPAKLPMLWQLAASALCKPSLRLSSRAFSSDALASSGCWIKVYVSSDTTTSDIGATCEPVSVSSATLLESVLASPMCARLSLICLLVFPGRNSKIFILILRLPWSGRLIQLGGPTLPASIRWEFSQAHA
jgi:hypothetical protein